MLSVDPKLVSLLTIPESSIQLRPTTGYLLLSPTPVSSITQTTTSWREPGKHIPNQVISLAIENAPATRNQRKPNTFERVQETNLDRTRENTPFIFHARLLIIAKGKVLNLKGMPIKSRLGEVPAALRPLAPRAVPL